ncbi:unnamed protein product [Thelazia callipaeda]|uniref:RabBD domain-containing protein n=1 Tax=Thelazia callipaeda TaxID=103827 RepID=A0A0N5D8W0_THECL|nr:unnamed protein product [Thelazia callipaeda]
MAEPPMPDLSHLSAEERQIIEEVFQRQRAEEEKETQISQKADQELEAIDKQINERKEIAQRLIGTQDDAICQICQKTKFADGIGHKCFYCQLRSCARCGGRTMSRNKPIWACSLCQKRQQILAKTGKWFQQSALVEESKAATTSSDSNRKFQRGSDVSNVPMLKSTILPGDMLAAKIRTYLSYPVTWQPSADQRRLIGHMILHKTTGTQGDLGLKESSLYSSIHLHFLLKHWKSF